MNSSRALYIYPDFNLFHTNTHLNSLGSIQHMHPYLAQSTNSIHSQRVMSGTQLWWTNPQMTTKQWRVSNSQPYDCVSCILPTAPSQLYNRRGLFGQVGILTHAISLTQNVAVTHLLVYSYQDICLGQGITIIYVQTSKHHRRIKRNNNHSVCGYPSIRTKE